jgi:hypothetical protein
MIGATHGSERPHSRPPLEPRGRTLTIDDEHAAHRMLVAALALIAAAAAQLLLAWMRAPRDGVIITLSAIALALFLWRPTGPVVPLLLLYVGVEAFLPFQTGAGIYGDWQLQYEMSRAFAGLSSMPGAALALRTPLFNALLAGATTVLPSYSGFQLGSVLLNILWLWPASRLLDGRTPSAIASIAFFPTALLMTIYERPWGLVTFFLLIALWGFERRRWTLVGAGLTGAILSHAGALGYVMGLVVWIAVRERRELRSLVPRLAPIAAVSAAVVTLPWLLLIRVSPRALFTGSQPVINAGSLGLWAATRPALMASSVFPIASPFISIGDWVLRILHYGAQGMVVVFAALWRRHMQGLNSAWWCVVGGLAVGVALTPSNQWVNGIDDAAYPAVILLGIMLLRSISPARRALVFSGSAALGALTAVLLAAAAFAATPHDLNLALKTKDGLHMLADYVTPWPGLTLIVIGALLCVRLYPRGDAVTTRRGGWSEHEAAGPDPA